MQTHYHEWLKRKHSDENACASCGNRVFPGAGIMTTKHIGRATVQINFCGERCSHDFYLANLNRSGREAAPCDYDSLH